MLGLVCHCFYLALAMVFDKWVVSYWGFGFGLCLSKSEKHQLGSENLGPGVWKFGSTLKIYWNNNDQPCGLPVIQKFKIIEVIDS